MIRADKYLLIDSQFVESYADGSFKKVLDSNAALVRSVIDQFETSKDSIMAERGQSRLTRQLKLDELVTSSLTTLTQIARGRDEAMRSFGDASGAVPHLRSLTNQHFEIAAQRIGCRSRFSMIVA